MSAALILALAVGVFAAEDPAVVGYLKAGNEALARKDYTEANSQWTSCLLNTKDIMGKVASECEAKLKKYQNRHTPYAGPKTGKFELPPMRVALAPQPVAGLTGEALRQARQKNMYEAFLDIGEFEKGIKKLREMKDPSVKTWEKTLVELKKTHAENAAFFPPEERVTAVQETFADGMRTVDVTLANGKKFQVASKVYSLSDVDKIDQPVGETDAQRLKRLGLSK